MRCFQHPLGYVSYHPPIMLGSIPGPAGAAGSGLLATTASGRQDQTRYGSGVLKG